MTTSFWGFLLRTRSRAKYLESTTKNDKETMKMKLSGLPTELGYKPPNNGHVAFWSV